MPLAHGSNTVKAFMTTRCPRCDRQLPQSGEVVAGGVTYPVFQCDECIAAVNVGGEAFEAAFTFALGPDGQPFDPADAA